MRKRIDEKEFGGDYTDVRSTFLSLTSKTYPHGHEEEVLELLPSLDRDEFGNYYKVIGERPTTMFTSHLDTADHRQNKTERYSSIENGEEQITTDGNTILGADDKAGVTVMLYMMEKKVPGLYYFFIGEERGGIGSKRLANDYDSVELVKDVVRCVSFDRRGTGSVITKQLGRQCCSDTFANALAEQYNGLGMQMAPDPTGIFTDSAMLMGLIPECTNISVGYMNEHTGKEVQNITHLEKLCVASCKVDWESLPTERSLEDAKKSENDYPSEYKGIVKDAKKLDSFGGVAEEQYGWALYFDIEGLKPSAAASELNGISQLIDKHELDSQCYTDNGYLIIAL
jgi:hypothetical protein